MSSCLSTHEIWGQLNQDDPLSWVAAGLEPFAVSLNRMYPGETAKLQDQQFDQYKKYRDRPIAYIEEILKVQPTPKQEEIANALLRDPYKVIVVSCNNYGKCRKFDDPFRLASGKLVRSEQLIGTSFTVYAPGSEGHVSREAKAENNGIKPCWRITSKRGFTMEGTYNHPLWIADRTPKVSGRTPKVEAGSWIPMERIRPGQMVVVPSSLPCFGDKQTISNNELIILAALIADGGLTQSGIRYSKTMGRPPLEDLRAAVESMGSRLNHLKNPKDWCISGRGRGVRNPVRNLLERYGLMGCAAAQKFIPADVFAQPKKAQALFLRTLYTGDGWAVACHGGSPEVGYSTMSERLAREVQIALLGFGIRAWRRQRPKFKDWVVSVIGRADVTRFLDEIGIDGRDLEPVIAECSKEATNERGKWLLQDAPHGCQWEEVVKIEPIGDHPTVAIEVPDGHTYFGPGFYEHNSHLAGGLVNWFYDAFDPGICITTAPRLQDVVEVLWKEVRMQRRGHDDFRGEMSPKLYANAGHYAEGYTGNTVTAFHGRHDERMFFILDEATDIKSFVWTGLKSMFKRTGKHHLLALLNPTDTTSPAYAEAQSGAYTVIRLSALEHPNVLAELRGEEPKIPGAVDTMQLSEWFADPLMFEEIHEDDFMAGDVMWPPQWADVHGALERFGRDGQRVCYRPGPEGQARVLGLWPTATPGAIWSDLAWRAACRELDGWKPLPVRWIRFPEIGCDVARGTSERADKTSIIVQIEGVALAHRAASGWDIVRTASELMEMADEWSRVFNARRDPRKTTFCSPKSIPIKVDDGGLGGGVVDILKNRGYCVIPINASTKSKDQAKYPLMRDQLWFAVPLAAIRGEIDLSRLSVKSRNLLRAQCMGTQWKHDFQGRRKVEKKEETKKRQNRSPDDSDAMNLAYCAMPSPGGAVPEVFSHYQGSMPSMAPDVESGKVLG